MEIDEKLSKAVGGGGGHGKKAGFLPDKMMIPTPFNHDISVWRKWKEEVTKHFDDKHEGMKYIMDHISKLDYVIDEKVMEDECYNNPCAPVANLLKWKHLYRALEKLTEGEAHKVISTVPNENGFEAWRQLTMRFEPELEAQKNTVLLELHSILVSSSVEETKNKLVELKVRIARAEDILGEKITDMQKKTALLQILDSLTSFTRSS